MATTAAAPAYPSTDSYVGESGLWSWLTTVDHKRIGTLYLFTALFFFLLGSAACFSLAANAQTLVLLGGTAYSSPDAAPLLDAVVLASDGVITAIGSRSELAARFKSVVNGWRTCRVPAVI